MAVEFISVHLKESRTIALRLGLEGCLPYDLTGYTDIHARFRKADGQALVKTLTLEGPLTGGVSVIDAQVGRVSIALTPADTEVLKIGERQDFTIFVFKGNRASLNLVSAVIKSIDPGTLLNGLEFIFTGSTTVSSLVSAYNESVDTARHVYFTGTASFTPAAGTYSLSGGTDNKRVANMERMISVFKQSV